MSPQEASQLLPDSPYVWHLAMAAGALCGDIDLLSFAYDRVCVVDGVSAHGGVGVTTALLHSLATAVCGGTPGPAAVLAAAVHRMVAAPQLWTQVGRRLLEAGMQAGDPAKIRLAGVFAHAAMVQAGTEGTGSRLDMDAEVVAAVCASVGTGGEGSASGSGILARVVKIVHKWPQSPYAWTLLAYCRRHSVK